MPKLSRALWKGSFYYRGKKSGRPSWRQKSTGGIIIAPRTATREQLRRGRTVGYEPTRAHPFGYSPQSRSSAEDDRRRFARKRG